MVFTDKFASKNGFQKKKVNETKAHTPWGKLQAEEVFYEKNQDGLKIILITSIHAGAKVDRTETKNPTRFVLLRANVKGLEIYRRSFLGNAIYKLIKGNHISSYYKFSSEFKFLPSSEFLRDLLIANPCYIYSDESGSVYINPIKKIQNEEVLDEFYKLVRELISAIKGNSI